MKFPSLLLGLLCIPAAVTPLRAQQVLEVSVRDERTGEPIRRLFAGHEESGRSRVGSNGVIRFDSLAVGRHRITLSCETLHIFGHRLLERDFEISAGGTNKYVVPVDASLCDQRPVLTAQAELRGYFESGFEHSRFVPCASDQNALPRGFEGIAHDSVRIWTSFTESLRKAPEKPWPKGARHRGYSRWYVEASGTLNGPGHYGHMGVADYELTIDTMSVVRTPQRGDCNRRATAAPRA